MRYAVIFDGADCALANFDTHQEAVRFVKSQACSSHLTIKEHVWPASPVSGEELGSGIGQQSPSLVLVDCLTRLALAIEAQTKALDKMAESNQGLIRAMAEDARESDQDEPRGYLNARSL